MSKSNAKKAEAKKAISSTSTPTTTNNPSTQSTGDTMNTFSTQTKTEQKTEAKTTGAAVEGAVAQTSKSADVKTSQNSYQNAKDGVKVEATPAANNTVKAEPTNATPDVKEVKMTEAKLTLQQIKIAIDELTSRFIDLTEAEEDKLKSLKAQIREKMGEREAEREKIKSVIAQFNFSPSDLFHIEALKEIVFGKEKAVDSGVATGEGSKKRAASEPRPSDSKPLLIEQPKDGKKGKKFAYRQGRVYEVKKQNKPYEIVKPASKEAMSINEFLKANHTQEALEKYFTEEGKIYFATKEGKEELADLLRVLKEKLADEKA